MGIVLNATGEGQLLNDLFNTSGLAALRLKLYTNTATLSNSNTPASFTEPAAGTGYNNTGVAATSGVTLSRGPGTWSIANAASPAAATYPSQSFAFTSAVTIQGYYVTDVTGANVVWAEAFPAPVAVSAAIGLAIIPRFGLGNVGTGTGPAGP